MDDARTAHSERSVGETSEAVPMIHVLAEDHGFADYLPAAQVAQVTAVAVAPEHRFGCAVVTHLLPRPLEHGHLGLLVLDGLLARHVSFGTLSAIELVGPGDVLRPWVAPRRHARAASAWWEVLAPSRMAALDVDFTRRVRPWPQVAAALIDRSVDRADFQLLLAGIRQARRVEDRVHAALWHLAGRWGRCDDDRRSLRLPGLTGQILAHVVGARRQSVSTALGQLTRRGVLVRHGDGHWEITTGLRQLPEAALASPLVVAEAARRRVADIA